MPYSKQTRKRKTTVRVPQHLLNMAKAYGLNVSQFLTIRLREFFSGHCVYTPLPNSPSADSNEAHAFGAADRGFKSHRARSSKLFISCYKEKQMYYQPGTAEG